MTTLLDAPPADVSRSLLAFDWAEFESAQQKAALPVFEADGCSKIRLVGWVSGAEWEEWT